jgi:PAS domain S-box-containing protein
MVHAPDSAVRDSRETAVMYTLRRIVSGPGLLLMLAVALVALLLEATLPWRQVWLPLYGIAVVFAAHVLALRTLGDQPRADKGRVPAAPGQVVRAGAAQHRLAFLAEAGRCLAASLDYEATLRNLAQLAVPGLGDLCIRDIRREDGTVERIAAVHRDPAKAELMAQLRHRYPPGPDAPHPGAEALRRGEAVLLADVNDAVIDAHTQDAEHAALIRAVAIRSHLAVPLTARGHTLGVLSLSVTESDRRYGPDDLDLAQALAARAALAMDNARLYRQAQEAAGQHEESRALLDTLMQTAPVGLAFVDRELRYVRLNDTLAAIDGVRPEDALGKTLHEVVPHLAPRLEPFYRRVLDTGEPILNLELSGESPADSGRRQHWLVNYYPVRTRHGKVLGVGVVVTDITERKLAEVERERLVEQLRAERAFLEAVLQQMPGGILIAEAPSGRVLLRNDQGARLVAPDAEMPKTLREFDRYQPMFASPRYPRPEDWPLLRALRSGEVIHGEEMDYRLADGTHGTIRASAAPVRDPAGRVVAAVTTWFDISERKRAEEAQRFLAEAGEALASSLDYEATLQQVARLAVPALADWCAIDILQEDRSLRRVAVAHPDPTKVALARELAGRYRRHLDSPEGKVLQTGKGVLIPEITDAVLTAYAHDAAHLEILRGLGLKSTMVIPLAARGRALGSVSFVFAESGRRYDEGDFALAKELARRAALAVDNARLYGELQEVDRRKDEFLAMLAHELRNPLAPITNAVQILKMPQADTAVVGRARDMMERQVQQLKRLVDDLLDVSRIMRGKIELRKERIDLAAAAARAVETSQPLVEAGGHGLTVSLPSEPVWLNADLMRLAQVIANLLNNAAKYTEPGGRIWLITGREGDEAIVRVKDTGIGIAPALLAHIFDLFVQADHARGRTQGGMGIGLTLVRSLVGLHGGRVEAYSEGPNRGSEFVIRLPALPDARRGRTAAEAEPAAGPPDSVPARRRVLVVDDNVDAADSLALVLRLEGQDVCVAHDGAKALEVAGTFRPDLVFLDLGMPGMDGYEVARRLRQQPGLEQVVLVALTGWGQAEDRRRTHEARFDHHLTKPADPQVLRRLLDESRGVG